MVLVYTFKERGIQMLNFSPNCFLVSLRTKNSPHLVYLGDPIIPSMQQNVISNISAPKEFKVVQLCSSDGKSTPKYIKYSIGVLLYYILTGNLLQFNDSNNIAAHLFPRFVKNDIKNSLINFLNGECQDIEEIYCDKLYLSIKSK